MMAPRIMATTAVQRTAKIMTSPAGIYCLRTIQRGGVNKDGGNSRVQLPYGEQPRLRSYRREPMIEPEIIIVPIVFLTIGGTLSLISYFRHKEKMTTLGKPGN